MGNLLACPDGDIAPASMVNLLPFAAGDFEMSLILKEKRIVVVYDVFFGSTGKIVAQKRTFANQAEKVAADFRAAYPLEMRYKIYVLTVAEYHQEFGE